MGELYSKSGASCRLKWGDLSSKVGELSSKSGASCLGASFMWGELSWGELSLGRIVLIPHPLNHIGFLVKIENNTKMANIFKTIYAFVVLIYGFYHA